MNSLNNIFGDIPIYWINLHDSTNRYNNMIKEFDDFNNHFRIEAVDGRTPEKFKNDYDIQYTTKINFTTSIVAVVCSHIKAIKQGYDNNHEMICVVEDDAHFELAKYFPLTIKDILAQADKTWDAIQLYHVPLTGLTDYKSNKKIQLIERNKNYSGTCYLINRKGMEKILNECVETDGNKKFVLKNNLIDPESFILSKINTYVLNVPFIYFYDSISTISIYIKNDNTGKNEALKIQAKSKDELIEFYKCHFIKY